jgi:hypothetical protein
MFETYFTGMVRAMIELGPSSVRRGLPGGQTGYQFNSAGSKTSLSHLSLVLCATSSVEPRVS